MRPLVSAEAARALDAGARERFLLSDDTLMETAACGMAAAVEERLARLTAKTGREPLVAALCGRGNNAGDALAVLRKLAFAGHGRLAAVVPDGLAGAAARRLAEAGAAGVAAFAPGSDEARATLADADLVLDGIAGIGYAGPRRPGFEAIASLAGASGGSLVAIDVPSGVGPWTGTRPEPPVESSLTLCVAPLKAELYYPGYRPAAGLIVPIEGVFPRGQGSDSSMVLLDEGDLAGLLPVLPPDVHKGGRGALVVHAGSVGGTGAAALASRAASASGAGSVTLVVDDYILVPLSSLLTAQMVRPRSSPGTRAYAAALAGPGWGTGPDRAETLRGLWTGGLPLVVDADGLRLLAVAYGPSEGAWAVTCGAPCILTPHPGEFAPLAAAALGLSEGEAALRSRFDTASVVRETARKTGAVVVLKGSTTWLGSPEGDLAVWDGREPALATAGSGDVLSGLAAGLLARGLSAWDAARAAVMAHGLAGRLAAAEAGFIEAGRIIDRAAVILWNRGRHGNEE